MRVVQVAPAGAAPRQASPKTANNTATVGRADEKMPESNIEEIVIATDAEGNPIIATDAEGNQMIETDAEGNNLTDEEGNPVFVYETVAPEEYPGELGEGLVIATDAEGNIIFDAEGNPVLEQGGIMPFEDGEITGGTIAQEKPPMEPMQMLKTVGYILQIVLAVVSLGILLGRIISKIIFSATSKSYSIAEKIAFVILMGTGVSLIIYGVLGAF